MKVYYTSEVMDQIEQLGDGKMTISVSKVKTYIVNLRRELGLQMKYYKNDIQIKMIEDRVNGVEYGNLSNKEFRQKVEAAGNRDRNRES